MGASSYLEPIDPVSPIEILQDIKTNIGAKREGIEPDTESINSNTSD